MHYHANMTYVTCSCTLSTVSLIPHPWLTHTLILLLRRLFDCQDHLTRPSSEQSHPNYQQCTNLLMALGPPNMRASYIRQWLKFILQFDTFVHPKFPYNFHCLGLKFCQQFVNRWNTNPHSKVEYDQIQIFSSFYVDDINSSYQKIKVF